MCLFQFFPLPRPRPCLLPVAQVYKSDLTKNYYSIPSNSVTFAEALQLSAAATYAGVSGHLFVPNSVLEFSAVHSNIVGPVNSDPYWIAVTDLAVEGKWIVAAGPQTGTDLTYTLV